MKNLLPHPNVSTFDGVKGTIFLFLSILTNLILSLPTASMEVIHFCGISYIGNVVASHDSSSLPRMTLRRCLA